jgi:hypothetical protein
MAAEKIAKLDLSQIEKDKDYLKILVKAEIARSYGDMMNTTELFAVR